MASGSGGSAVVHSYVAVGKEATFGTYASATTAIEALSCSFTVKKNDMKLDGLFVQRGYNRRVMLGKEVTGALEQYLHPHESVLLLANALAGQVSSTAGTNSTLHSISAGNFANSIAALSFNVRKGDTLTWRYHGGRCNTMKLTANVGDPVKCSYDMVFRDATQVADDISLILSISSVTPFVFTGAEFRYGASEGAVSTESVIGFELTVNNNLKADANSRQLGTDTLAILPGTKRDIMLKVTQRFDTTTTWLRFISGTEGAVALFFSGTAIVAATTTPEYFHTMEIRLPRVQQRTGDPELKSSGDILTADLEYAVLVDNPNTTTGRDIGLTVRNSTASY